jgi:hypothetical protein
VSRKTRYTMAMYTVLTIVVMTGIFGLMTALGDKVARWGGYGGSLPLLGLLVLFIGGHLILIPPRRRRRR